MSLEKRCCWTWRLSVILLTSITMMWSSCTMCFAKHSLPSQTSWPACMLSRSHNRSRLPFICLNQRRAVQLLLGALCFLWPEVQFAFPFIFALLAVLVGPPNCKPVSACRDVKRFFPLAHCSRLRRDPLHPTKYRRCLPRFLHINDLFTPLESSAQGPKSYLAQISHSTPNNVHKRKLAYWNLGGVRPHFWQLSPSLHKNIAHKSKETGPGLSEEEGWRGAFNNQLGTYRFEFCGR